MTMNKRKREGLQALISTNSVDEASEVCKVPSRTLYRWLKEKEFHEAYEAGLNAHFAALDQQKEHWVNQNALAALRTAVEVMNDKTSTSPARLRAAQFLFSQSVKQKEFNRDAKWRQEDFERKQQEAARRIEEVTLGLRRVA